MKIKDSKIILINIIYLTTIFLLCFTTILFILHLGLIVSCKDARYYTIFDLANAQMIDLEVKSPTSKDWDKYDVNVDRKIDNADVQIINQMLLGYYDYYIVFKRIDNNFMQYCDIYSVTLKYKP